MAGDIGFSELTIAGLLGHASRCVTQRYIHLDKALVMAADKVAEEIEAARNAGEMENSPRKSKRQAAIGTRIRQVWWIHGSYRRPKQWRRAAYDADLGGGVYKQRVARAGGGGKSGGFRTIELFRLGTHSFSPMASPRATRPTCPPRN